MTTRQKVKCPNCGSTDLEANTWEAWCETCDQRWVENPKKADTHYALNPELYRAIRNQVLAQNTAIQDMLDSLPGLQAQVEAANQGAETARAARDKTICQLAATGFSTRSLAVSTGLTWQAIKRIITTGQTS